MIMNFNVAAIRTSVTVTIPRQRVLKVALFTAEGFGTFSAPVSVERDARGNSNPTVRPSRKAK